MPPLHLHGQVPTLLILVPCDVQGTRLLAVACLLTMFGISSLPLTYVLQGLFTVSQSHCHASLLTLL